jgi:hypothetical protein
MDDRAALPQPVGSPGGSPGAGILLLTLLLSGCGSLPGYEAFLVLADAGAAAAPSPLKRITPAPSCSQINYTVADRRGSGDLYLPGQGEPRAGIVLVPGAVPKGKDDPRLVAFAHTLARAGFAVLAPEISGFRRLRIRPGDAREVADAFAWLVDQAELAPAGRAGIGAFSYAVGPALLAALEEDVRERLRFVVGIGGYHDLGRAIRFFTTGYFEHDGRWSYIQPGEYGKLVFALSSQDYLAEAHDRETLNAMVEARLRDPGADLGLLAARLGAEGRAVYELLAHRDPALTSSLIEALPPALRTDLDALNLGNKDLGRLKARLLLIHGKSDNLIPYPESIALAQAAPAGQARVFLVEHVLGHVDLGFSDLLSWQFLSRELPDIWRMGRAVALLLAERDGATPHSGAAGLAPPRLPPVTARCPQANVRMDLRLEPAPVGVTRVRK